MVKAILRKSKEELSKLKSNEETSSDYDREKLQERMAKLSGGVAVIKVGKPQKLFQRKEQRLEDALLQHEQLLKRESFLAEAQY